MVAAEKKTILVVDDEDVNLQLLCNILQKQGYETLSAGNGNEALQMIKRKTPDMVLLDVEMPGPDGMEVLAQIRKTFSQSIVPVIMITVKDESKDIVNALDVGANDYVTKPIDISVLLARIRTHLSLKIKEQ